MSDSEDEVWEYKSLIKQKKVGLAISGQGRPSCRHSSGNSVSSRYRPRTCKSSAIDKRVYKRRNHQPKTVGKPMANNQPGCFVLDDEPTVCRSSDLSSEAPPAKCASTVNDTQPLTVSVSKYEYPSQPPAKCSRIRNDTPLLTCSVSEHDSTAESGIHFPTLHSQLDSSDEKLCDENQEFGVELCRTNSPLTVVRHETEKESTSSNDGRVTNQCSLNKDDSVILSVERTECIEQKPDNISEHSDIDLFDDDENLLNECVINNESLNLNFTQGRDLSVPDNLHLNSSSILPVPSAVLSTQQCLCTVDSRSTVMQQDHLRSRDTREVCGRSKSIPLLGYTKQSSLLNYFKVVRTTASEQSAEHIAVTATVGMSVYTGNQINLKGTLPAVKKYVTSPVYDTQRVTSRENTGIRKNVDPVAAKDIISHRYNNMPNNSHGCKDINTGENPTYGYKRKCPFYKLISGTTFSVDAFNYGAIPGCTAYFLSHFHYDHYQGLTRSFSFPIYCSQVTGNLVKKRLRVSPRYIHCLPIGSPQSVDDVTVILLDANHCPGSVMFLFKLHNGRAILHTGDFRAHPSMYDCPLLKGLRIDSLYLDTTYCDPQYVFPPQAVVIASVVETVLSALETNPKTLIVCGTYTIGKERVFTAIAGILDCKIAVSKDKKDILDCLEDEELSRRITTVLTSTRLHVVPMKSLNHKSLCDYLRRFGDTYTQVLAFEPTGWTYHGQSGGLKAKVNRDGVTIYGVPYSEHSSYDELKSFVQFVGCRKIIATVNNGNKTSRDRMNREFTQWLP